MRTTKKKKNTISSIFHFLKGFIKTTLDESSIVLFCVFEVADKFISREFKQKPLKLNHLKKKTP